MLGKCSGHFLLQSFLLSCFSRFCALVNGLDHSGALFCLSTLPIPHPPPLDCLYLTTLWYQELSFIFSVYMSIVFARIYLYICIYAHNMSAPCPQRPEELLDPLELVVVSCCDVLGTELRSTIRAASALNLCIVSSVLQFQVLILPSSHCVRSAGKPNKNTSSLLLVFISRNCI